MKETSNRVTSFKPVLILNLSFKEWGFIASLKKSVQKLVFRHYIQMYFVNYAKRTFVGVPKYE